jgi:hypothetical protein
MEHCGGYKPIWAKATALPPARWVQLDVEEAFRCGRSSEADQNVHVTVLPGVAPDSGSEQGERGHAEALHQIPFVFAEKLQGADADADAVNVASKRFS